MLRNSLNFAMRLRNTILGLPGIIIFGLLASAAMGLAVGQADLIQFAASKSAAQEARLKSPLIAAVCPASWSGCDPNAH